MTKEVEADFLKRIKKVNNKRHPKITHSWGVYDGYKYYRKIRPKDKSFVLKDVQYFAIIRTINKMFVDEFLKGLDIIFPEKMGSLRLVKNPAIFKYAKDNKIKTYMPIDWDATLKLWYEDAESYKNKTLVKKEEKEYFRIKYDKTRADYNNKSFYKLEPNRELKLRLKEKIRNKEIDAFLK